MDVSSRLYQRSCEVLGRQLERAVLFPALEQLVHATLLIHLQDTARIQKGWLFFFGSIGK